MIKEFDLVVALVNITEDIPKDTIGTVLSMSKDKRQFVVEFVDEFQQTIGNGMTMVDEDQVKLYTSFNE